MTIQSEPAEPFRDKVRRLRRNLTSRGEHLSFTAPPIYRLAWLLGWNWKPPLFNSFLANAVIMGTAFAPCPLMLGFLPGFTPRTGLELTWSTLLGMTIFGLIMACKVAIQQRRLKLPNWDTY
ncbi:DUF6404 family protein [Stenotrophomonas aracearum]|jgi:hypothetical protein|uniref:DUF6404 family protein n=1 Tax=Stenotrophomonas aracearum TaxID=3003272 RepID=A0ABY9YD49_9GAMM|nr:DUF6404 family protein [Stenotrophomonas sp. A5588]WNH48805.1 DUF6404 family protein [Stenotrophomonas sp. A5588]